MIIAGMATQPSRTRTSRAVVKNILEHVDLLVVHLDGFSAVPRWLRVSKVLVNLHRKKSQYGAAGKFDCLQHCLPGDTVLIVDDDVSVNPEAIDTLLIGLSRQPKGTVVGFHGSTLKDRISSYVLDRNTVHMSEELQSDLRVDVLATCLIAWRFEEFAPKPKTWPLYNMVDLQFALDAKSAGIDLVLLSRPRDTALFQSENQKGSIYSKLLVDDREQTELARKLRGITRES